MHTEGVIRFAISTFSIKTTAESQEKQKGMGVNLNKGEREQEAHRTD